MEIPKKVRGMQDILPDVQVYNTFLKKVFRHEFRKNGFKRISTPVLEAKTLFTEIFFSSCNFSKSKKKSQATSQSSFSSSILFS